MTAAILRRNHRRAPAGCGVTRRPGTRIGHLVAALAALGVATASARADTQAGTVLTLRGDCVATTAATRRTLGLGGPVYVGDVVETGGEARLKLRMIDGSIISVASASTLTIADYSSEAGGRNRDVELSLASGLLRAVVSKVAAPARFEVDTAAGVAAVRGTDWFVRVDGTGTTQVGVLTGLVRLRSRATDRAVDIPTHSGAKVQEGKDPGAPRRWLESEFDDVIQRTNVE